MLSYITKITCPTHKKAGRLACYTNKMKATLLPIVQQSLDAAHAEYKVLECDPEHSDTASFCEKYGYSLEQGANTLIVASKTTPAKYAACLVLPTTKLDSNKALRKAWGNKKSSFAPMDVALELTGMEYGGITIFGLPDNMPVFVDARVLECDEVVMGGGNRSSKILIKPQELTKLPNVQIIENLAKPTQTNN